LVRARQFDLISRYIVDIGRRISPWSRKASGDEDFARRDRQSDTCPSNGATHDAFRDLALGGTEAILKNSYQRRLARLGCPGDDIKPARRKFQTAHLAIVSI